MPSAAEARRTHTLRIERSMAGLAQLGGWVDAIAAARGLTAASEYALRLCLEEAAANVVMHGAPAQDSGFVTLRVEPTRDALLVCIEDRCAAFDPLHVPAPDLPTNLDEVQVGGLGIHLMRQYTRAIRYERVGDTNRLLLTIAR